MLFRSEVKGMIGNDYNFTLSQAGKQLASERFQVSQYAGACPVSLNDYHTAVKAQSAKINVDRQALRNAYSDLIVTDRLLDQLGPAIISQTSIFVYGPTGNGKTSLAERMLRVYKDAILIPYAVEVDNQIVSLFDPVVHQPLDHDDPDMDPRWLVCKRPCIVVGGELIPSMLELRLDESSGIYAAPLQMKANNGILLIDDFGRQLMSPRDLLNRWIVPLDRRIDYLTLRYGVKFQIPFECMVVFSTNLEPSDLADEAFLRRIQYKMFLRSPKHGEFSTIFTRFAQGKKLEFTPDVVEEFIQRHYVNGRQPFRRCHPRDDERAQEGPDRQEAGRNPGRRREQGRHQGHHPQAEGRSGCRRTGRSRRRWRQAGRQGGRRRCGERLFLLADGETRGRSRQGAGGGHPAADARPWARRRATRSFLP